MKKHFFFFIAIGLIAGCEQSVTESSLKNINGYWEISETISRKGETKEFKINETIDYFELKNGKGFRKKVMPQFNGHYTVNNQKEEIVLQKQKDHFYLVYTTPYGKWRDEIISLSDEELALKNEQGMEYHYKRPMKFSIK
ncbi:lipocalin family protein [Flavobacterium sp.]|uniref:lipocalin family protein n=1 Tax=Flavobacterium sp. TaxID=239 RepID=UPI00262672AB|nr:lipocalin family protein [Flavobacterium sp.]